MFVPERSAACLLQEESVRERRVLGLFPWWSMVLPKYTCVQSPRRKRGWGAALIDTAITLPVTLVLATTVLDLYRIANVWVAMQATADEVVRVATTTTPGVVVPSGVNALVFGISNESGSLRSRRQQAWTSALNRASLSQYTSHELQSLNSGYGLLAERLGGRGKVAFPIPDTYQASELKYTPNCSIEITNQGDVVASVIPEGSFAARSVLMTCILNSTVSFLGGYLLPPIRMEITRSVPTLLRVGTPAIATTQIPTSVGTPIGTPPRSAPVGKGFYCYGC